MEIRQQTRSISMNSPASYCFFQALTALIFGSFLVNSTVIAASSPSTPHDWYAAGQQAVKEASTLKHTANRAKNVILFIGDGMGVATVTAARILEGQLRGESG